MTTHAPVADPIAPAPRWMKAALLAAAVYNVAWGTAVVLFPIATMSLLLGETLESTRLWPQLWGCIGMIVGVYGVGYAAAAFNPARHWPIVLVGFLGKIFGPIGFIDAALKGQLPWSMGVTNITNDVIWWVPFGLILLYAWRTNRGHRQA